MPITCPKCNRENADGAVQCTGCGANLAAPAAPASGPHAGGKPGARRPRTGASRLAYRGMVLLLLLALAVSQVQLLLVRAQLRAAQKDLEHARTTIERALTTTGGMLHELRLVPPDGQSVRLGMKLGQCLVEEATFSDSRVTLRISNPGSLVTQPFVRVLLFDAYGASVGDGVVVDYRTRSLQPAEAKVLSERVRAVRSVPRYFVVTDQRAMGD